MTDISRRRTIVCLLWPIFVLALIGISTPVWFPQLGNYLVVSDPLQKSDAIVVLGGGDPQRLKVAVSLYNDKWAPLIITLGGMVPDYMEGMGEKWTFAELAEKIIEKEGAPPENVIALIKGTSTFEEADAVREYALDRKFKSLIAVTSIYHTRRARAVYRKMFKNTGIEIIMRPATGGIYKTEKWWTREDDLVFVNSEWVKLILYKIKGRI